MFIQEFYVLLGNFEDLATQAADHAMGGEEIITPDAILISVEANSNHRVPSH
jgi:hypothetical protein